jgi:hypothetical protein
MRGAKVAGVLGAVLTLWACSANPPTAILYLVIQGDGKVAVTRTKNPDACEGNGCPSSGSADGGALEIPYASGSEVILTAQASPGWQFQFWSITASGAGSAMTNTSPVLDVTSAGSGLSVLATFGEAGAPADGGGASSGSSADAGESEASAALDSGKGAGD